MPWKDCGAMEERVRFISEVLGGGDKFSYLCRKYGVSRVTGYKWVTRYHEVGSVTALRELSRRPKRSPHQTPEEIVREVVRLRKPDGWGARTISFLLREQGIYVSIGTVHRILKREGLVHQIDGKSQALTRFERREPNELVQLDFKGPMGTSGNRNEPLTMIDDHSRYALAVRAVKNHSFEEILPHFIDVLSEHGVPDEMLLDHGTPWWNARNEWGLTKLSVFLIKQKIKLRFSGVRHPQTQGKIERFHRTLRRSVIKQGAPRQFCEWQPLYDGFRYRYNHIRPHQALGMRRPAELYRKSERVYMKNPTPFSYPPDLELFAVDEGGNIRIDKRRNFVCEALTGETVAVQVLGDIALVRFRHMAIREIHIPTGKTRALVFPVGDHL